MKYLGSYFGSITAVLLAVGAVVCITLSTTSAVVIEECRFRLNKTFWKFDEVDIPQCTKKPCVFYKWLPRPITMTFTALEDMAKVISVAYYEHHIAGIGHKPRYYVNVCDKIFWKNGTKAECPLVTGGTYVYKDEMRLEDDFIFGRIQFHWDLRSINANGLTSRGPCVEIDLRIYNPRNYTLYHNS